MTAGAGRPKRRVVHGPYGRPVQATKAARFKDANIAGAPIREHLNRQFYDPFFTPTPRQPRIDRLQVVGEFGCTGSSGQNGG